MCTSSLILLAALDLGALFSNKDAWTGKAEFFAVEHAKEGFSFASEDRNIVNCLKHDTCTWHGLKVWETKVYFDKGGEDEKVLRVELSLYNRGDAKDETMDVAALKEAIAKVAEEIDPADKTKPEKTSQPNGTVRYRRAFAKADPAAELVWGLSAADSQKNRSVDYLRLTLTPKGAVKAKVGALAKRATGKAGKAKIKDNVTKSPNGDVYIDNVPMVDQGQKGYCAVAASERVLRYYGVDVDEHEIAQAAGTSAEGGTSTRGMKDSVQAIGRKYKLATVVTYGDFEKPASERIAGLVKEVANYNKAAKKLKKKEIAEDVYIRREGNTIYYSYRDADAAMDPEVLRDMKVNGAQRSKFTRFMKDVRDQVNKGIPLFWGVTLGTYPEPESPQSRGGHIRLIIGYNDRKKEILYTDTWGAGHELKRMPAEWAWTISHCLLYMKPLR